MAPAKTHIMRWAPQDYRTSRVRMRSAMTGDRDLRLVYFEALNALHEHGGRITSEPERLSDLLLLPVEVIARTLPVLLDLGTDCDGGLVDNGDGTISNRRIVRDLAEELEFRQQQAEQGRRGGRAKAKARASHRQAKAKPSPSDGQANGQPSVSPPAPAPAPSNGVNQTTGALPEQQPVAEEPQRPRVVVVNGLTGQPQGFVASAWIKTREQFESMCSEAMHLAQQAGKLHDTDPPDEMARAASYPGARLRKVNPATMTHDRLVNTLAALRERCGLAKQAAADEPFDAFKRAGLA